MWFKDFPAEIYVDFPIGLNLDQSAVSKLVFV